MKMSIIIPALCLTWTAIAAARMAPSMAPMTMDAMAPSMAPMMSPTMMEYNITLLPQNEVPGVPDSGAFGYASLDIMTDSDMIMYTIGLSNFYGPILAHIHAGNSSVSGPVIVPLWKAEGNADASTPFYGTLISGMINPQNFTGPAKGLTLPQFLDKYISTGDSYVNVHSVAHPNGQIRGQVDSAAMMGAMAPAMGPSTAMAPDMMMTMAPGMAPMPMGMPASA